MNWDGHKFTWNSYVLLYQDQNRNQDLVFSLWQHDKTEWASDISLYDMMLRIHVLLMRSVWFLKKTSRDAVLVVWFSRIKKMPFDVLHCKFVIINDCLSIFHIRPKRADMIPRRTSDYVFPFFKKLISFSIQLNTDIYLRHTILVYVLFFSSIKLTVHILFLLCKQQCI